MPLVRLVAALVAVAIVGASCSIDVETAHCPVSTVDEVDAYSASLTPVEEPTQSDPMSTTRPGYEEFQSQVLVTTQPVPAGLEIQELIAAPTVYLSANVVPRSFLCPTSLQSVAELLEYDGYVISTEVGAGRFLDTRQLVPAG